MTDMLVFCTAHLAHVGHVQMVRSVVVLLLAGQLLEWPS